MFNKMADGQPEMIPMPDMSSGEQPQISRQLSPEEERAVLLNFMGNMYGEAKKMDSNIIGPTNTLQRGKSEEIKKQIEQVYTQPQQSAPSPPLPVSSQPRPSLASFTYCPPAPSSYSSQSCKSALFVGSRRRGGDRCYPRRKRAATARCVRVSHKR